MRINRLEIKRVLETKRMKEDLEKEISQRNYTSLRYVLFDKSSKLPHATHLYYENNKYYIENRDERGELIGNPYIFEDFIKAKNCFFEVLGEVVALNNHYNNTFGEVPYYSPLWSKLSKDNNKITEEPSIDACRGKMGKGNQIGQGKDGHKSYGTKRPQAPGGTCLRHRRNSQAHGGSGFISRSRKNRFDRWLEKERQKKEENIHMTY